MGADVSGFLKGLNAGQQRAIAAAVKAVDLFGEQLVGNAQELAPVDTGALKASGTTTPAEISGDEITKAAGFNTNYAAAVHENLSARHDQGQAKYMEAAMQNLAPKFGPFVSGRIRAEMGG